MTVFIDSKTGSLRIGKKKCKHQKKAAVVVAARKFLPMQGLFKKVLKTKKELCRDMKKSKDMKMMSRKQASKVDAAGAAGKIQAAYRVFRNRKPVASLVRRSVRVRRAPNRLA